MVTARSAAWQRPSVQLGQGAEALPVVARGFARARISLPSNFVNVTGSGGVDTLGAA
jgi:hypothetical protein